MNLKKNAATPEELNKPLQKPIMDIILPITGMNPGSHRALIVQHIVEDLRDKSGLIIPSHVHVKDKNQNNVKIETIRYFVVKAAQDFTLDNKQPDLHLEFGDEIWPLIWDGTTPINLPSVRDWDNKGIHMQVIHDSEIFAWKKNDKPIDMVQR
jgi:hypothetical protein